MTDQPIIDAIKEGLLDGNDLDATDQSRAEAVLRALRANGVLPDDDWQPSSDGLCQCLGWCDGEWLHIVRVGTGEPWRWVSDCGDVMLPTAFAPLPEAPQ